MENANPKFVIGILAVLTLVAILSAKEWFTENVQSFASMIDVTISDAWLIIFIVAIFLIIIITAFFQTIEIRKK